MLRLEPMLTWSRRSTAVAPSMAVWHLRGRRCFRPSSLRRPATTSPFIPTFTLTTSTSDRIVTWCTHVPRDRAVNPGSRSAFHSVTPLILIVGGSASLFSMGGTASPFGSGSLASRDTAPAMVECLRSAEALAEANSNEWQGFRLSDQVIIVASERTGPVVLAGDSAPPAESKRAGLDGAVFV